jgi:hypothetical protein
MQHEHVTNAGERRHDVMKIITDEERAQPFLPHEK